MQTASAVPVLYLWKELEDQGFTPGQRDLIPADTVLDMLQKSVVLIGIVCLPHL